MIKKLILVLLLVFVFLGGFCSNKAFAEQINSFDVSITAHKDGTMNVKETIGYDFGNLSRHGIYRNIPLVSRVGDLYRITEINLEEILRDGSPENYSQSSSNSQTSIKIGRANALITGLHTYTIFYLVKNGIGSNYEDHDEIFWNVTGNSWTVSILKASGSIATDFGVSPDKALCFTGAQSLKEQNCDYSNINFIQTTKPLSAKEGLTAVWNFPKSTFPPSILQKVNPVDQYPSSTGTIDPATVKNILWGILGTFVFFNLILAPFLLILYFKNKRKERFGQVTVNFNVPKDANGKRVAPAEAGSIDIYKVDQNDLIATIFDLAIKKYLKMEQIKNKVVLGIFGGDEDYVLTKLKSADKNLTGFEQVVIERLFKDGDSVKLSSLKADFYETYNDFQTEVFNSLITRGFYKKNPGNQMTVLLVFGILFLIFGNIILGPVLIYLSRKLNGRTALGDKTDWDIDGLKIFLKNMKQYYTFGAENLYLVEEFIPYAIAFGLINEFMEQLKVIYPKYQPTWYSGNLAFYAISSHMMNSMNSSFVTHAPSSSSGFSGGGFSGGGGGGGGGGSW